MDLYVFRHTLCRYIASISIRILFPCIIHINRNGFLFCDILFLLNGYLIITIGIILSIFKIFIKKYGDSNHFSNFIINDLITLDYSYCLLLFALLNIKLIYLNNCEVLEPIFLKILKTFNNTTFYLTKSIADLTSNLGVKYE